MVNPKNFRITVIHNKCYRIKHQELIIMLIYKILLPSSHIVRTKSI